MADLTANLIEQVKDAVSEKTSLNLIGGNTKAFMGRFPIGQPVALSDHRGVVDYRPSELVITARAGTAITEIQALLERHNQTFVGEPPSFNGKATLGGSVAAGVSGSSRPYWGSLRDAILGVKLVNGLGEHLRFGGQVMKNVAGYDLSRLQAGALGAFGILTEVSLRVRPKPDCTITLAYECPAQEAITQMRSVSVSGHPVSGAAWVENRLYIRLCGSKPSVLSSQSVLGGEVVENHDLFWRNIRSFHHPFFNHTAPLARLSVSPSTPHLDQFDNTLIDWGGGVRWVYCTTAFSTLAALAEKHGGHVSSYRTSDRDEEVFHPLSEVSQRIHRNLKAAFDPHNLFNPGRLYSWLGAKEGGRKE